MGFKEKIYQSILEIVAEDGFSNSPVSRIAKKAEISPGSIYNHFANKEDIIDSLYLTINQEIHDLLATNYKETRSIRDQYLDYWLELYRYFMKNPDRFNYLKQYESSPYFNSDMKENREKSYEPLNEFIEIAIQSGEFRETESIYQVHLMSSNIKTAVNLSADGRVDREGLQDLIDMTWNMMTE